MSNNFTSQEFVGASFSGPPVPALAGNARASSAGSRYESHPNWGMSARGWEAGETDRLNQAHWQNAKDDDINQWLREQLTRLRARATYESRQNPTLSGIAATLADAVVGPDGPTLQIQSDDEAYNNSLERVWRDWFSAPTFRPNVSGAAMLKLWVRNLPKCGEFLSWVDTDEEAAGPVQMRLRLLHPRRLASPLDQASNPRNVLGVEFDRNDRPVRYWITETDGYATGYVPVPPDLIIHEFSLDEEGQARGFPWFTPSLPSAADLRDYDAQIQDAARLGADHHELLYTDHPEATLWKSPESTTYERRTVKMVPPGWKPWAAPAMMPPVQYPDFRAERQRDLGRPFNMPLLMIRLDSSKHNYSSARLDTQSFGGMVQGIQCWLSGTPASFGTLNRLVDLVAREARFSVRELRRTPPKVTKLWTWPQRPHVDPSKEADAETSSLESRTLSFSDALADRGQTLVSHIQSLQRDEKAFEDAGIAKPAWMTGAAVSSSPAARAARANASQEKPVNA